MTGDGDHHHAGRILLSQLHSTDPSLFSFSFSRDLLQSLRDEGEQGLPKGPLTRRRSEPQRHKEASSSTPAPPSSRLASIPSPTRRIRSRPDQHQSISAERGSARIASPFSLHSPRRSASDTMYASVLSPHSAYNFPLIQPLKSPNSFSDGEGTPLKRSRISPTREIYLHPSQIFSPPSASEVVSYFGSDAGSATQSANGSAGAQDALAAEGQMTMVSLPPILTLEELQSASGSFESATKLSVSPPQSAPSIEEGSRTDQTRPLPSSPWPEASGQPLPTAYSTTAAGPLAHPYGTELATLQSQQYSTFAPPPPQTVAHPGYYAAYAVDSVSHDGIAGPGTAQDQPFGSYDGYPELPNSSHQGNFSSRPSTSSSHSFQLDSPAGMHAEVQGGTNTSRERSSSGGDDGPSKRKSSNNIRTNQPHTGRIVSNFPPVVTNTLKAWLLAHTDHPYPTEDEKRQLCDETNLNMNQISNWFINARRRILPTLGSSASSSRRHHAHTMAGRAGAAQAARGAPNAAARYAQHPYVPMPYMAPPAPGPYPPGYPAPYSYPYPPQPSEGSHFM